MSSMAGPDLRALPRDIGGRGAIKFALVTCLLATGIAMHSQSFRTNPLLAGPVNDIRQKLPEIFETLRRAMGG